MFKCGTSSVCDPQDAPTLPCEVTYLLSEAILSQRKHGEVKRAGDSPQFRKFFQTLQTCISAPKNHVDLRTTEETLLADCYVVFLLCFVFPDEPFLSKQQLHQSYLAVQRGGRVNR